MSRGPGTAATPAAAADRGLESVRTLSTGIPFPGCERLFTPTRPNHHHCRPACRKRAERNAEATRRLTILERLDVCDPGRPE